MKLYASNAFLQRVYDVLKFLTSNVEAPSISQPNKTIIQ